MLTAYLKLDQLHFQEPHVASDYSISISPESKNRFFVVVDKIVIIIKSEYTGHMTSFLGKGS